MKYSMVLRMAALNNVRIGRWEFSDADLDNWTASQLVADYASLEAYRERNASFNWLPDTEIDGRVVGVGSLSSGDCFTYVQSQDSGVITGIGFSSLPNPPLTEICQRAIDLTEATIDKIPE